MANEDILGRIAPEWQKEGEEIGGCEFESKSGSIN
jgi:hypothetical protein